LFSLFCFVFSFVLCCFLLLEQAELMDNDEVQGNAGHAGDGGLPPPQLPDPVHRDELIAAMQAQIDRLSDSHGYLMAETIAARRDTRISDRLHLMHLQLTANNVGAQRRFAEFKGLVASILHADELMQEGCPNLSEVHALVAKAARLSKLHVCCLVLSDRHGYPVSGSYFDLINREAASPSPSFEHFDWFEPVARALTDAQAISKQKVAVPPVAPPKRPHPEWQKCVFDELGWFPPPLLFFFVLVGFGGALYGTLYLFLILLLMYVSATRNKPFSALVTYGVVCQLHYFLGGSPLAWVFSPLACASCFLVGTLHAYLYIFVRCLAGPVFFCKMGLPCACLHVCFYCEPPAYGGGV
jgi:hypothetical protein